MASNWALLKAAMSALSRPEMAPVLSSCSWAVDMAATSAVLSVAP